MKYAIASLNLSRLRLVDPYIQPSSFKNCGTNRGTENKTCKKKHQQNVDCFCFVLDVLMDSLDQDAKTEVSLYYN